MRLSKRARCHVLATLATAAISVQADAVSFNLDWGLNTSGQLGNGTTVNGSTPAIVSAVGSDVNAIGTGSRQSFAADNGGLYGWGMNQYGQLGVGSVNTTGKQFISTPTPVIGLSTGVTAVASGASSSMAIQRGALFSWGSNQSYTLGNGSNLSSSSPVPVLGMSSGVTTIAAGSDDEFAIQNGALFGWGSNLSGKTGTGIGGSFTTVPTAVVGLSTGVTAIACGALHTLAIKNGGLNAWGYDNTGQLGIGSTAPQSTPVSVPGLASGVTAVAGGSYNSMAVQNGAVFVWGRDPIYTIIFALVPQPVTGISGNIVSVATTGSSDYALSADGSIWDWGFNDVGQLGLGTVSSQLTTPQQLHAPAGYAYTSVAASSAGSEFVSTILSRPDTAVSYSVAYTLIGSVAPVLDSTGNYALANLSLPPGTATGSVQVTGFLSGTTGTEIVYLDLADPTQAPALIADLDALYGGNYASLLTNDPFSTPYQVELSITSSAQTANYFNFDFSTVVNAGADGASIGSVPILNIAVVPEPTGLAFVATASLLARRRRKRD